MNFCFLAVRRAGAIEPVPPSWGKSEHGGWMNRGGPAGSPSPGGSERTGEKWQGGRGPEGETEDIRGYALHLAVLLFAALVCKLSQRKYTPQPAARRAWENRGRDNRRLGAFFSKCKLSHLSAINQEVYGAMIFAGQFKNHKAGTLSGCRKQNSTMSTAAAVNQLLLTMICCPALRWGVYLATNGKQDSRRKWHWPQRTAFPGGHDLGSVYSTVSIWGLGTYFWQTLIVSLDLFSPCSHVELKAIHIMQIWRWDQAPEWRSNYLWKHQSRQVRPELHTWEMDKTSSSQSCWCLLASGHSPSPPRGQTHLWLHRVSLTGPHTHLMLYPHLPLTSSPPSNFRGLISVPAKDRVLSSSEPPLNFFLPTLHLEGPFSFVRSSPSSGLL